MKILTLISLFIFLFTARFLNWLAIFQQKEYRLDRIKAFLGTEEGKKELKQIFSKKNIVNPKKWKRPATTSRAVLISGFSILSLSLPLFLIVVLSLSWQVKLAVIILFLILEYIFIPIFIGVATAISSIPAKLKTENELKKAKNKLAISKPTIIGIGGSYGKTSTKYFLESLLSQKYQVFKTPKSFNTPYSIAKSINQNYHGEKIVLLEYGAYQRGEIEKLTRWFKPNHAIITGFTEQHLHLFGSIEDSQRAESELVVAIDDGKIWFNADDSQVEKILDFAENNRIEKISYSANQIDEWQSDDHGHLILKLEKSIITQIVGKHYLSNLAGAIAVANFFEVNEKQLQSGIVDFEADERFIRSYVGKNVWILDDGGTSNPKGFAEIIKIATDFKEKNKILIVSGIVDLGDESDKIHSNLAHASDAVFDQIYYVGEAGRAEFEKIIPEKLTFGQSEVQVKLKNLTDGSLVVIEGRMPGWIKPDLQNLGVKL